MAIFSCWGTPLQARTRSGRAARIFSGLGFQKPPTSTAVEGTPGIFLEKLSTPTRRLLRFINTISSVMEGARETTLLAGAGSDTVWPRASTSTTLVATTVFTDVVVVVIVATLVVAAVAVIVVVTVTGDVTVLVAAVVVVTVVAVAAPWPLSAR